MNEIETMLSESTRRSRHLWAHVFGLRESVIEGLPIVKAKLKDSYEKALHLDKSESYRNEVTKNYEDRIAREEFATSNALFILGYSIADAQALDCIRIALRADADFCKSSEKSFGQNYKGVLESAGLVRRAEILLDIGRKITVVVPHMKGSLSPSTLNELTELRNGILHGDDLKMNNPIEDLNGKLEYLKHTCIYLSDLVMLKYDLFRTHPDELAR